MKNLFADLALLPEGWSENARITLSPDGKISAVERNELRDPSDQYARGDILLPAPGNVHSHAFQLAMAGMTESRGLNPNDSFWTWRQLMYRFLDRLTPEHIRAISAMAQIMMLESGYSAVGEFHYVHHQPGGAPYDNPAETSNQVIAASGETGIGLTHLPVLYMQGGADGRALRDGQLRFGCDFEGFAKLVQIAKVELERLSDDASIGVAPHSLRAVDTAALASAHALFKGSPIHIHIAEQTAEVDEIVASYGTSPVSWLLSNAPVDGHWCFIHATHMTAQETADVARSGAVAGLCPVTEANLGDGIFNATEYMSAGGMLGVGTDSNVRINLTEELRTLEYTQRLRHGSRAVLANNDHSTGRCLFDAACAGGARALGRKSGAIVAGNWADLLTINGDLSAFAELVDDSLLDAWIFSVGDSAVRNVWSAGRHIVHEGRHVKRGKIEANYRTALRELRSAL